VGNPEEPWSQRTRAIEGIQLAIGLEERLLDNILAVHDGPGHPRTVTVQARSKVADRLEKRQVAGFKGATGAWTVWTIHIDLTQPTVFGIRGAQGFDSRVSSDDQMRELDEVSAISIVYPYDFFRPLPRRVGRSRAEA
jgi:hypothetical protein